MSGVMLAAALLTGLIALGAHIVVPWRLAEKDSETPGAAPGVGSTGGATRSWAILALPLTLLAVLPWLLLLERSAGPSTVLQLGEVRLAFVLCAGLLVCDLVVLTVHRRFDRPSWLLAACVGLVVSLALGHALSSARLTWRSTTLSPVLAHLDGEDWVEDESPPTSSRPPLAGSLLRGVFLLPLALLAAAPVVGLVGLGPVASSTARRVLGAAAATGLLAFFFTLPTARRQGVVLDGDHLTLVSALVLCAAGAWLPPRFRSPVALVTTVLVALFLSRALR